MRLIKKLITRLVGTVSESPGELLWSATFDQPSMGTGEGDYVGLKEWDVGAEIVTTCNQDSTTGTAAATRTTTGIIRAGESGGYAMYTGITTPNSTDEAACRTFRNTESMENEPLYYFISMGILNANVDVNGFLNIFEYKSRLIEAGTNKVSWNLGVVNTTGTNMALRLGFNSDMDTGPFAGTPGGVPYFFEQYGTPVQLPANEFFTLEVYLRPSQGFDGIVKVWQNGTLLTWNIGGNPYATVHSCRTNQAGGVQTWAPCLYGKDLNDGNTTIETLISRAAIATGRIGGTDLEPHRNLSYCYVERDTWVQKASPNTVSTNAAQIRVHDQAGANGKVGLIKFDVAHLAGKTVTAAELRLYTASTAAANRTINCHEIKVANNGWVEAATWNFADGAGAADRWAGDTDNNGGANAGCSVSGTDYEAVAAGSVTYTANDPLNTLLTITLSTAMVQRWVGGSNYGAALLGVSANDFDVRSVNYDTDPSKRPMLVVTYTG